MRRRRRGGRVRLDADVHVAQPLAQVQIVELGERRGGTLGAQHTSVDGALGQLQLQHVVQLEAQIHRLVVDPTYAIRTQQQTTRNAANTI